MKMMNLQVADSGAAPWYTHTPPLYCEFPYLQSERDLSIAGMYIQSRQHKREIYQSPACIYKADSIQNARLCQPKMRGGALPRSLDRSNKLRLRSSVVGLSGENLGLLDHAPGVFGSSARSASSCFTPASTCDARSSSDNRSLPLVAAAFLRWTLASRAGSCCDANAADPDGTAGPAWSPQNHHFFKRRIFIFY